MKRIKIAVLVILAIAIPVFAFSCADGVTEEQPRVPDVTHEVDNGNNYLDEEEEYDDGIIRPATYIEPRPAYPELPVRDLDGYTFRIISRSEASNAHWWNLDISAEELTGDPINDAVFTRNAAVEEKYNISIVNIPSAGILDRVRTAVRAGSDDFDLVVFNLASGQETLAQEGMLYDLKSVPYVDLTRRWWDQRAIEQLTIGGRLFFTTSDLTIRDKDAAVVILFSKTLAQNHELPNLYQMVDNGTWTMDAMFDMMRLATVDLSGDGNITHEDQVGLLTQRSHALMLFNASGERTVSLDSDGFPELTIHNERAIRVVDFIREMHGSQVYAFNAERTHGLFPDIFDDFQIPMFASDRALFYHANMNRVSLLRSMETDFGILPPPKFDENQQNYYVGVESWCASAVSIPISVPDIDITGLILEALTFESRYTLIPAYYHINLITRFARDEESHAMIDLIFDNRVYDLGEVYRWANVRDFFHDTVSIGGAQSLTVFYERSARMINRQIELTVDRLQNVE